jgi:hypothetical protein
MFTIDNGKSKNAHKAAVKRVTDWISDVIQPKPAMATAVPVAKVEGAQGPTAPAFIPHPPSYPPPLYMIMVSEIQCTEPDCVPIETLVVVMENDSSEPFDAVAMADPSRPKGRRWIEKILKPVTEVTLRDVFQLDVLLELGVDEVDERGLPIPVGTSTSAVPATSAIAGAVSAVVGTAPTLDGSLARVKSAVLEYVLNHGARDGSISVDSKRSDFGASSLRRFDDVFKVVTDLKADASKAYNSVNTTPTGAGATLSVSSSPAATVVPMKMKTVVLPAPASSVATLPTPPGPAPATQLPPPPVQPSTTPSSSSASAGTGTVAPTVVPMKVTTVPAVPVISKNQNKGKAALPGLGGAPGVIPPTRHKKGQRARGCPCCDPDNIDNVVDKLFLANIPA